MFIFHDPDEWETVSESKTTGTMFGVPMGSCSFGQRRRDPSEVAKIKEGKRIAQENEILAEADAIRARRATILDWWLSRADVGNQAAADVALVGAALVGHDRTALPSQLNNPGNVTTRTAAERATVAALNDDGARVS